MALNLSTSSLFKVDSWPLTMLLLEKWRAGPSLVSTGWTMVMV